MEIINLQFKPLSDEEFLIMLANALNEANPMIEAGTYIGIDIEFAKAVSERLRDISEKV